jgi:hypothetical protein
MGDFGVVKAGPDVEPEPIGMRTQAWVGTARFVTAQGAADIGDVHTSGDAFDNFVGFGDGRLLEPHLFYLINKGGHELTPE